MSVDPKNGPASKRKKQPPGVTPENTWAEDKYIGLVDAAPDAMLVVDRAGTILLVNTQTEALFGFSRAELLGQPVETLIPGRFREGHARLREDYFKEPRVRPMGMGLDLFGLHRNGSEIPIEISLSPLKMEEGEFVIAVIRDVTEHRRANRELRAMIGAMQDVIMVLDGEGRYVRVAPTNPPATYKAPPDLIGRTLYDFFPREEADVFTRYIRQAIETKTPVTVEYNLNINDQRIWFEATVSPMDAETVFLIARDVTSRKTAEDALQESEQRYRSLFEDSPISVWEEDFSAAKARLDELAGSGISDLQGYLDSHPEVIRECASLVRVLEVNRAAVQLYKARDKDELRTTLGSLLPEENLAQFRDELLAIARGQTHYNWEGRDRTITGELLDVNISWSVAPGHESDYSKVIVSIVDISERKRVEAAREHSETLFRSLFELSPEAILLIDPHDPEVSWRILDCNLRASEMNGYSRDELIGQSIDIFNVTPGTKHERAAQVNRLHQARVINQIAEHRHKDGTIFPIEYSTALINIGGRELVIGIDRDITERKEAERVLQDAKDFAENVIQTANVIFIQLDPSGKILKLNKAAEEITGYSRDEVEGRNWFEFLAPRDRYPQVWNEFIRITSPGQTPEVYENPVVTKNGEERQILWKNNVLRENGLVTGTISFGIDITDRKRAEAGLRRQLERLAAMSEIDRAITSSFDMRISLSFILSQVTTLLGVDAADVLLFNPVFTTLDYAAGRGFRTSFFESSKGLRLGEGYAGRAALDRRMISIPDLSRRTDNPRLQKTLPVEGFVSYFGIPLISKGAIRGVLEIFHRSLLTPDEEWLDFLNTLAGQAALAIENATLFEGLQRSNVDLTLAYDATIEGWSRALDLRDKETEGHTQRVTDMTLKLAQVLGFDEMELVQIRRGALLHDIGKMGVADHILLKPGPLTDEEWISMRKHPEFAYEMLSPIHYLKPALDIPYCHHERWDGTGYPRGLKGEEIPLTARIFAVVDVYDALVSDRPYRPAWSKEKTLDHIQARRGSEFDPQVVDAFMRMMG